MPALQEHRLARPRDPPQQAEVLHVPRTDLDDVGRLLDGVGVLGVHQLGDDADARLLADAAEDLQALQPQPLEGVRAGPRLERPGSEEPHAAGHQPLGRAEDHRLVLDRARPGDDREVPAAELPCGSRTTVSCACISRLASLYGLVTRSSSMHAGQDLQRPRVDRARVAGDPDRGAGRAGHRVRRQAHLRIASSTRSICSGVEWLCITTSMIVSLSFHSTRRFKATSL